MRSFEVSTPGKVLIVGGYLVLDPRYSGCVIAVDARFYVQCRIQEADQTSFRVVSPQFTDDDLVYDDQMIQTSGSKNPFVEQSIKYALMVAYPSKKFSVGLTLKADNDFYSQSATLKRMGLECTEDNLAKIPRFNPLGCLLKDVNKTGLGSSAALVTALVTAVYLALSETPEIDLKLMHNLSQVVHCLAQGKVGSGFDVSSAVYGSHIYTRFDPQHIEALFAGTVTRERLMALMTDDRCWTQQVIPFQLPGGIDIMLADVQKGSNTPGMVKKVLHWQASHPVESKELWDRLDGLYQQFIRLLSQANRPGMIQVMIQIRQCMQQLTKYTQVDIEPSSQTDLIDHMLQQNGVITAACPGAGGSDAIFLLVEQGAKLKFSDGVCPLLCRSTDQGVNCAAV